MRAVGFAASIVFALVVLGILVVLVRSIPDLNRYRRLRKM
jgi:hypothetical protein